MTQVCSHIDAELYFVSYRDFQVLNRSRERELKIHYPSFNSLVPMYGNKMYLITLQWN